MTSLKSIRYGSVPDVHPVYTDCGSLLANQVCALNLIQPWRRISAAFPVTYFAYSHGAWTTLKLVLAEIGHSRASHRSRYVLSLVQQC